MSVSTVETIDTHTLGEPTRIVIGGFPELRGKTLASRSRDLLRRHDHLRRALMWEPRGHRMMFGAIVVRPVTLGADLGLVFMDGGGTVQMCVHGTIGAVTALIEMGHLRAPAGGRMLVDTPAAPVRVRVRVKAGTVAGVVLEGVPSHSVASGLKATVAGREIRYDLAYGGNLVALVRAPELAIPLEPGQFRPLVSAGMELKERAQTAWLAETGRLGAWPEVVSAVIFDEVGAGRLRDLVVFRDHAVDRSPCGTCFSALMAQMVVDGQLRTGEWIECENLLGLALRGRLRDTPRGLQPELEGSAHITGEHRFRIDSRDPLAHGFTLG